MTLLQGQTLALLYMRFSHEAMVSTLARELVVVVPTASDAVRTSFAVSDTGLLCLLLIARFYDLPADGAQARHQFGESDRHLPSTTGSGPPRIWISRLDSVGENKMGTPGRHTLPAVAKRKDGRYMVLAKVEDEKVLVQDPGEERQWILARADLQQVWTGQLLLFTTRAAPSQGPDIRLHLVHSGDRQVSAVAGGKILLASCFLQLFELLTPLFTQVVIDKVLAHKALTCLQPA